MIQVLCTLDVMHDSKLAHYDLSLGNLMIDSTTFEEICIKLIDFGISIVDKSKGESNREGTLKREETLYKNQKS